MMLKIILFATTLGFISTYMYEEPFGKPIININNCCATQAINNHCETDKQTLAINISKILNEYNQRIEKLFQSLGTESRIRDCQDIKHVGHKTTGVYTIYPDGTMGFPVRCDMDTVDGGWTVIQRRVSNSDFYKTWNDYQIGFGNLSNNFWLGNQQIHTLTSQGWYELRVDLKSVDDMTAYAAYNVFAVGSVDSGYKLTVDGYSGNAGDSLAHHNGRPFSTKDRDNDNYSGHCAQAYTGAWWYGKCHDSNLNGKYGATAAKGPVWETFKGNEGPLKITEMKIRRWVSKRRNSYTPQ
ncbi:microfibril-associated glycoprotein 4-like [Mercenaria mercenaria]|uniref:microfibril-associated glycoprotein 4-like n=1 Tax=Mercenaria mercenaria TaxID=6596 RepID=UPI00234E4890|nr:microfibril-associated glycoprotein 4-like [Mercenaria mercenaria]